MSGAWFASTPIEPVTVRLETISTSSSKTFPSGVRTSTGNLLLAIAAVLAVLGVLGVVRLGLFRLVRLTAGGVDHVVDRPLKKERSLRQVVVLAVDDLLEGAHRLLDRHVDPRRARERLRHEERL